MIAPGAGWRFQEHIASHELYEDQVMEHEVTGHLAVRRVYAPELLDNPTAAALLRGQAQALAALDHAALPRWYGLLEVEGRLCWLFENLRGQTLRGQLRARGHLSAGRWAAAAFDLIELFRDLSRAGVSLAALRLEDLVVLDETLRIASLAPVPKPPPAGSPSMIVALAADKASGVWHRGDPRRQAGENAAILNLLFHLAAPSEERSLAEDIAIHEAQQQQIGGGPRVQSVLGIEGPIEQVLLRFHHRPDWKWDELAEALMPLVDRGAAPESTHVPAAGGETFHLSSTPRHPNEHQARQAEVVRQKQEPWKPSGPASPSSSSSSSSAAVPAATPAPAPKPAATTTATPSPDDQTPGPRRSSAEREVFARSEIRMEGSTRFEDDASEDRSYLIPEQRAEEKAEIIAQEIVRKRRSLLGGLGVKTFAIVLIALVAVGGVAAGVMFLPDLLSKKAPPNQTPVAAFTASSQKFAAYEKVRLDASASNDPEGVSLVYTWQVRDLPPDQWRIEPNKNRQAAKPELQIYAEGTHVIELKVFDDAVYSLPVDVEVSVGPPVRQ